MFSEEWILLTKQVGQDGRYNFARCTLIRRLGVLTPKAMREIDNWSLGFQRLTLLFGCGNTGILKRRNDISIPARLRSTVW